MKERNERGTYDETSESGITGLDVEQALLHRHYIRVSVYLNRYGLVSLVRFCDVDSLLSTPSSFGPAQKSCPSS